MTISKEQGEVLAACHDCGRPYGDEHGFPDLIIPHAIWNEHISPKGDEGGLLCPSCLCKRAFDAGLSAVEAMFTSGPFDLRTSPPPGIDREADREWPDIGVEPLTLPRPRDIDETKARLRAAMVTQQPHVPNGAALVWRTDLLDVHHRAIRIEALAELRGEQIAALKITPNEPVVSGLAGEREAQLLAFVLDCSAGNPAHIGSARNQAVILLESLGIEAREPGVFYSDATADIADAKRRILALRSPSQEPPTPNEPVVEDRGYLCHVCADPPCNRPVCPYFRRPA